MKVTPSVRADLADKLRISEEPSAADDDAAWDAEIERRIREVDAGEVECVPWEHVVAELRAKYG